MSFDHRDPGTAEHRWAASRLTSSPPVGAPGPGDRVLVLAAHPDDETLGAGGLIGLARRAGADVVVVVASDGEGSHPASPTHTPAQLAVLRRGEVRAALDTLAPGVALHALGLPDGALASYTDTLTTAVDRLAAGCTHVVSTWRGDGHTDHEACARIAADVAAGHGVPHWQFPIWLWHWGDPDGDDVPWDDLRALPLPADVVAAKAEAVHRYVSQERPLSDQPGDEAVLPAHVVEHFARTTEAFVVATPHGDAASPGYFDRLYAGSEDPWDFGTRFYEARKREVLLAALPRTRFRRAFEPGCATGLLTERLARRVDEVVAWDVAAAAVESTERRIGQRRDSGGTVHVATGRIPDEWPGGRFDLVVLSEVGYYCRDLDALAARVLGCLTDDGVVAAVSWRHPAADHPHTADETHAVFHAALATTVTHVEEDFLLHVWSRDPRSVAVVEGIVPERSPW